MCVLLELWHSVSNVQSLDIVITLLLTLERCPGMTLSNIDETSKKIVRNVYFTLHAAKFDLIKGHILIIRESR